jgi:hypothetical protein
VANARPHLAIVNKIRAKIANSRTRQYTYYMNLKLSLGTLITIVTLSIGLGSTYITLTNRIDDLEVKVKVLEKKLKKRRRVVK